MNNVKYYREKHHYSVKDLAHLIGVTRQELYFIERGGHLSKKVALKLSRVLKENPIAILGNQVFVVEPITPEDRQLIRRLLK